MDPHDYGYVPLSLLLECLNHPDGALLHLIDCALGGGGQSSDDGTELLGERPMLGAGTSSWCSRWVLCLNILNESSQSDRNGVAPDLTWGEVLPFIPFTLMRSMYVNVCIVSPSIVHQRRHNDA
jgi:hypothetical protein